MANITVRNIPESVFEKLRLLSEMNRRSLNNELVMAIERGVQELEKATSRGGQTISPEAQIAIWKDLSGKWKEDKSKPDLIQEIYEDRTIGRDISL